MTAPVWRLADLPVDAETEAGGKARVLARLCREGYPVPDGFVILPSAFQGDTLCPAGHSAVLRALRELSGDDPAVKVAVRSSASGEDAARTSFAGEFETVLNVAGATAIVDAVHQVRQSRLSARAAAYSASHEAEPTSDMAVLVQRMVAADFAGVLFTADPLTASHSAMVGRYVAGLGEALVAGEADGQAFTLQRPAGRYLGPREFARYAGRLFRLARRLERTLGAPQDIEFAMAGGRVFLLQSRPVTTLNVGDLDRYEINESLAEDTLWVNTNVGEAIPDVFTPLTWSVVRRFDEALDYLPGYHVWSGNICGRVYSKIGRRVSIIAAVTGWDGQRILGLLGELFGPTPPDLEVPLYPYSRLGALRESMPRIVRFLRRLLRASRDLHGFVAGTPAWCAETRRRIAAADEPARLLELWRNELGPYSLRAWWGHTAGSMRILRLTRLERALRKRVGEEETSLLLSTLGAAGTLASLGPVTGIGQVARGEISRQDYLQRYGHRGPHEFELALADPAEDPQWLDRQIAQAGAGAAANTRLAQQQSAWAEARGRFVARWPNRRRWLDKRLAGAAEGARLREAARSEFTRVYRLIRAFAQRAGDITGAGDDVFFLYLDELLDLLKADQQALAKVADRRKQYAWYQSLPPLPSVIRGRFDPAAWLADPNRRSDLYDAAHSIKPADSPILRGHPGASGSAEGRVRVLNHPDQADTLQEGEILVASTTNVGWTPLFPRAAALVTDIGAPLSHAAIVARELGIPAVVGCGRATALLRTGDRVRVDGSRGTVERLDQ